MNLEILSFGIFIGGIMAMFFIGLGVVIKDVRHYFSDKDTTERGCVRDDNADDSVLGRSQCRSSNNRCTEQDIREHARKLGIKLEEGAKKRA